MTEAPPWLTWLNRILIEQSFDWPPAVSFEAWRAARHYRRRLARQQGRRAAPKRRRG